MKRIRSNHQKGYALLLMLLSLMAVGGFAFLDFAQDAKREVDQSRFEHNKRVLEEAKQALLMYAYNYPVNNPGRGPGRIPCPDMNNDGSSESSFNCISGSEMVGRFPWNDPEMDFYDARDASGARLWYGVSKTFARTISPLTDDVINSDTPGEITIHDLSGTLMYDGFVAGIAAVIIAPGSAIDRNGVDQDRSVGNGDDPFDTTADTDPGIINATNYLDIFGALDNTDFVNSNAADGFVLGPITNASGSIIVNDQIILITAEELSAMAEKATFQAYRDALDEYTTNIGVDRYPWLDPYNSDDGLTTYDAVITSTAPNPVVGRMPSIFANYFDTYTVDTKAIVSELVMTVTVNGDQYIVRQPASGSPDILFRANGNLVSTFNNGDDFSGFYWDGHETLTDPNSPDDDIWEACPFVTGTEEDCNRDTNGNFIGTTESEVWLKVRIVSLFTLNAVPSGEFQYSDRTATPIDYWDSADAENPDPENHIFVSKEYFDTNYFTVISYVQDSDFQLDFSIQSSGSPAFNAGDSIEIGLRYYPVIPLWALDNGWHNMMQVAYSSAMQPGGDGTCDVGLDCLTLLSTGGVIDNKLALLVLSGNEGDLDYLNTALIDSGGGPLYFEDDLDNIFEVQNNSVDLVFDNRPFNGNDVVFLLE